MIGDGAPQTQTDSVQYRPFNLSVQLRLQLRAGFFVRVVRSVPDQSDYFVACLGVIAVLLCSTLCGSEATTTGEDFPKLGV